MKWIPYDSFSIYTDLQPCQVIQRISQVTEEDSFLLKRTGSCAFTGHIDTNTFKIAVCLSYRNSFRPVLYGSIKASGNGSLITIKQKLPLPVMIFMMIWFSFALLFMGTSLMAFIAGESLTNFFISCAMCIFAYSLANGGFWLEAHKSRITIEELLSQV